MARIEGRGAAGISRDRLTAAESALSAAVAHRAVTRRATQDSASALRDAERAVRNTPETQTIRVHSGVETPDPAYVGHFSGKVGPHRFYSAYKLARGTLGEAAKRFHGTRLKQGAYDHTYEGLAGQMASRAQAVAKASLHDRVVNELGIKMPTNVQNAVIRGLHKDVRAGRRTAASVDREIPLIRQGLFTRQEAEKFAESQRVEDLHNPVPTRLDLTPITAHPANALDGVKDLQRPGEINDLSSLELRAISNAMDAAQHSTSRNITLIPKAAADRFTKQYARQDGILKQVGRATQQFRRTVLPYSTHWMAQIGSEAAIRGMIAGVFDPRYVNDGRRLVKRLTQTPEGRQALAEMVNSTFYKSRDPLAIFHQHGVITSAAHAFAPTKAIIIAHNKYANFIGHAMYGLEHNVRVMGLGKLAHAEVGEFSRNWSNAVRIQGQAMEELARKLETNPALVAKLGRSIDDTFGKYNKFSPGVRAAIQSYAPFMPWYLNAAKFVLWTLPAKHPVASSLLASLRQTMNQDMADGKKLPLNAWAMQELGRLSPFGIFTPESPTPSLSGAWGGQDFLPGAVAFPQALSSIYNVAGVNSFGQGPLTSPSGDAKAGSNAAILSGLNSLIESLVPLTSKVQALREHGKPGYGTSTLWSPQTKDEAGKGVLDRIFNPLYGYERAAGSGSAPQYAPGDQSAPTTSGGWGGWGGGGGSSGGGWGGWGG
jgi:hypothetical protein